MPVSPVATEPAGPPVPAQEPRSRQPTGDVSSAMSRVGEDMMKSVRQRLGIGEGEALSEEQMRRLFQIIQAENITRSGGRML